MRRTNSGRVRWITSSQPRPISEREPRPSDVVIFTDGYTNRFTKALKMEADFILKCMAKGAIVYVFTQGMSPSDVRANLLDNAPAMGPLDEWIEFVMPKVPNHGAVQNGR